MIQPRDSDVRFGEMSRDGADIPDLSGSAVSDGAGSTGLGDLDPEIVAVLESAARLQRQAPDAVLVGGTAAAYYARHRLSYDHDHVLADLRDRFDLVLEAIEREPDWVMNRVTPGKIIFGALGDIEAGVRQLIRRRPLEFEQVELPSAATVNVPTLSETLRIKAFLIVRRNQVRDYLDVAALSDHMGSQRAAAVLSRIDDYYADESKDGEAVATQVVRQLGDPQPSDTRSLNALSRYKGLTKRWQDWNVVREQCGLVAARMLDMPDNVTAAETGGGP